MASRVLIVRTSALGDVVHCLPALAALRRGLPAARLGWVVEEVWAPLLAGHPDLDELLEVRLGPWRRRPLAPSTWRGVAGLVAALDRFAPEVVLDLMGNHKAGVLAALTLADRRLGLDRRFRREPSSAVWISQRLRPGGGHAVDRALAVVEGLGIAGGEVDFGGEKLLSAEPGEVRRFVEAEPPPWVLIQPGAGWGNKRYPPAAWGEVARRLAAAAGLPVWAVSGPGEEPLAAAVAAASGGAARPLAAPTLPFLAALLRRAAMVLGGDTGPLHLAHALGRPVLCVMGPTDPSTHGPYAAPERALWVRLPCSFCHRRFDDAKACLLELPPERVAERALALLAER